MKQAAFFQSLSDNRIQCLLCPHKCTLQPGHVGLCRVRKNIEGVLYAVSYGNPIACHADPIEKKPLFHFYPGSYAYSIATIGCNFQCWHCQNADISQASMSTLPQMSTVSPENIVHEAKNQHCQSIAYTYTEPTVFYEYVYDIAQKAQQQGIKNVLVTNGYINEAPLRNIAPFIDAANIDLKSMRESFYQKICHAHLQPVLDSIQLYHSLGIWLELTTLIIPGYNDSSEELQDIASFIAEMNPSIPWHISAFHPSYKLLDAKTTPSESLELAYDIGKKSGLEFVYMGNIGQGENTFCPVCHKPLILRHLFQVDQKSIQKNHCIFCGAEIPGVHLGF